MPPRAASSLDRRLPARLKRARRRRSAARPAPQDLRGTLLRLCGGALFLAILLVYSAPLRAAAGHARDAVRDATAAGRLAAAHEVAVFRYSVRYGISLELAAAVERAALLEGIDPDLAFRLVRVESRFDPRAVSPAGALGLTQLMPATARDLLPGVSEQDLFDRDLNLRLGLRYLRWLLDRYEGDLVEALHAYNRGLGTVERIRAAGGDPANGYAELVLRGGPTRGPYRGTGLAPSFPLPVRPF